MVLSQNLEIAVHVDWDPCNKNRIFEECDNFDIKKFFAEKGISINTLDTYDDFTKCDYIVFFEITDVFRNKIFLECLRRKLENKLIYFAFEGELWHKWNLVSGFENPANYFKYIFTWDDALVDNKKFFKFNYHCSFDIFTDILEPKNRTKLLTSIIGNIKNSNPKELYSKRIEIIDFFENNFSDDYEFYGRRGWDETLFKNYRGSVESKYHTYLNYKFAICFENSRFNGYITEKILDCLAAKTVPIYLGAPDIAKYIPSNCFIDYTQFDSIRAMYDFIKNMDDSTYNNYIRNINSFLSSDSVKPFTRETFYTNLYKVIEQDQNNSEIFKIRTNERYLILFRNILGNINKPIRNIERNIRRTIKKSMSSN